jgi:hypothetical protein
MRRFVLGWKQLGYADRLDARIVNYADDFVICCRGTAQKARQAMVSMMTRLKLTINEAKTHVCQVPDESFDFLGYTIGRYWYPKNGQSYIGVWPSRKRITRLRRAISDATSRQWLTADVEERIEQLNRMLEGWANYFRLGSVSKAYRAIDFHAGFRLRQWLRRKHKIASPGTCRYPDAYLHHTLGLVKLASRTTTFRG